MTPLSPCEEFEEEIPVITAARLRFNRDFMLSLYKVDGGLSIAQSQLQVSLDKLDDLPTHLAAHPPFADLSVFHWLNSMQRYVFKLRQCLQGLRCRVLDSSIFMRCELAGPVLQPQPQQQPQPIADLPPDLPVWSEWSELPDLKRVNEAIVDRNRGSEYNVLE